MTTYYVSSNIGSDNNAGTSTTPFATLQAAADHTHAGDRVEVMNGTYTGWPGGNVLDVNTSGTASAPSLTRRLPDKHQYRQFKLRSERSIKVMASYIVI